MTHGKVLVIFALIFLSWVAANPSRNVSSPNVNPGCTKSCSEPWVVHVKADGENDTIHHLWGMHAAPSFLFATTDLSAKLKIDWAKLQAEEEKSIQFDSPPSFIFGFAIPNLILFNDLNDKGKLDGIPDEDKHVISMSEFEWKVQKSFNDSMREAAVIFRTSKFRGQPLPSDIHITIQMAAYGVDGRSTVLPHLLRTPDSAQLDIVLDRLFLNLTSTEDLTLERKPHYVPMSGFAKPRWAFDVFLFTAEKADGKTMHISKQKSLDDENTPGVFHLDEITTPLPKAGGQGGYLQWRPVSYLTSDRDINYSTFPNINETLAPLDNITTTKSSLAYALLGEDLMTKVTAATTLAFGQPKDNFYTGNNYTTWTVAMGQGSPPTETFSTMVIVVISLGVGIPVLMFLIGGVVIASRRCRRSSDPLLLN
ncbi:glycosylated lysosomal membrane protein-like [Penaeus japonicus]|uniref:glycosylated lysosomal membrane protein-like n=1 Tax=Penaeus japonicus TaxID=27405 RepID=UPI001C70FE56|nr:glycosylated lysosomal membrane protein-like [Penaeus japonicus]